MGLVSCLKFEVEKGRGCKGEGKGRGCKGVQIGVLGTRITKVRLKI